MQPTKYRGDMRRKQKEWNLSVLVVFCFGVMVLVVTHTLQPTQMNHFTLYIALSVLTVSSLLCLGLLNLLAYKLRRVEKEIREEDGICVECGYDLAGHTHKKCPECGTPTKNR